MQVQFGIIGYTLNGIVFLLLAVLLATSWRGRLRGGLLTASAAATAVWSLLLAASDASAIEMRLTPVAVFITEILRSGLWLLFVASLLRNDNNAEGGAAFRRYIFPLALLVVGFGLAAAIFDVAIPGMPEQSGVLVLAVISINLLGLILIEQVYRNSYSSAREVLKFLFLGVGLMFGYDLFLYSSSILLDYVSPTFWEARSYVFLACAPLVAVAAQRSPDWSVGIFVSRQIVFYTASLVGIGVYFLVLAAIGHYLKVAGGEWGIIAQYGILAGGVLALFIIMISSRRRAQIRVFVDKHFFQNKYDYRIEWLRLIRTLTSDDDDLPLKERSIRALGQIVDSPAGTLWVVSKARADYRCVAAWNTETDNPSIPASHSLVEFLSDKQWLIDLREYESDPKHYAPLELDVSDLGLADASFIVPLGHHSQLLGFVVLTESHLRGILNYEDHDLLKTTGLQIASYLSQELLTEQMAESRQFEAFNRLTAFLMHDLKNLIAQQTLVVSNAKKFKHKPEFVDDAMLTIESGVARMRKVLDQLAQGTFDLSPTKVNVKRAVLKAVEICSDRQPIPIADDVDEYRMFVDGDKFRMVLVHLIRNAQDATGEGGEVKLSVGRNGDDVIITVADDGVGMDADFIRERLFKPFDSTKGVQGMGIGAYQVREFITLSGGSVDVQSVPDEGTRIVLTLPIAEKD